MLKIMINTSLKRNNSIVTVKTLVNLKISPSKMMMMTRRDQQKLWILLPVKDVQLLVNPIETK